MGFWSVHEYITTSRHSSVQVHPTLGVPFLRSHDPKIVLELNLSRRSVFWYSDSVIDYSIGWIKVSSTLWPPSSTLPALIGSSAFAFNKNPQKPYIFWKLKSSRLLLIPLKKIKILTRFRNEKLFVKVGVTVNLSPGQPKINGRSQLRSHSLLNTFD